MFKKMYGWGENDKDKSSIFRLIYQISTMVGDYGYIDAGRCYGDIIGVFFYGKLGF